MKSINPEYAKTGLVFLGIAWVIALLAELSANPNRYLAPVTRGAVVAALILLILKGNRIASILLVAWSVLALSLAGVWLNLFLMVVGVTLYLWAGGSKVFRSPATSREATSESPQRS